ncbi:MAG: hypothetical protein OES79_10175, partial [Planctomycetota bacterium]|nr:hypothetical protein [Planctomycetota bacterium]
RRRALAIVSPAGWLPLLAVISAVSYLAIAWLSVRFGYEQPLPGRPIPAVLVCLALAFVAYLLALRGALRLPAGRRLLVWIIAPAILFRVILLFSVPIQEVDINRYIWDGSVTAAGVSPYRYSPQQVLQASAHQPLPADLARLVAIRDGSPGLSCVLSRVHYGELLTIYPPVSQAVFAVTGWITPAAASVDARIVLFKSVFLLFDLGTLGLILALLQTTGRHLGWSLAYAWCPLVIKEIANSGHLDAIAVFFCVAAIFVAVRAAAAADTRVTASIARFSTAGILLALAVGAKLYPIVLAPWLAALCLKRLGPVRSLAVAIASLAAVLLLLYPMWPHRSASPPTLVADSKVADLNVAASNVAASNVADLAGTDEPPLPPPELDINPHSAERGLTTFLRRWEMNDFLFMLLFENLRPGDDSTAAAPSAAWFCVVPDGLRRAAIVPLAAGTGLDVRETAFHVTRLIMAMALIAVAVWAALRTWRSPDVQVWLEAAFLTLAWLWLLCPTQNPWYWTWPLPLIAFARSRWWLAVSGLALLYYLRFWFDYQWYGQPVLGTAYRGASFFDFCMTWVEFGPWLAVLALSSLWRWRRDGRAVVRSGQGNRARKNPARLESPAGLVTVSNRPDGQAASA